VALQPVDDGGQHAGAHNALVGHDEGSARAEVRDNLAELAGEANLIEHTRAKRELEKLLHGTILLAHRVVLPFHYTDAVKRALPDLPRCFSPL
jgi:hypothetical protein